MARFHVMLGSGERIVMEAEAVDNVPEFVHELREQGYESGRKDNGEAVALVYPHVAIVELI